MGGFTLVLLSFCTNSILLLCCSFMSLAHTPRSNGTDRLVLLAFKDRITHDPFRVLSSWNDSISYCEWPGVICGGRKHQNRVRALQLWSKGFVGSLPPQIGNLSFLREISFQNNSFYGEIPNEVSFLSRLRYLYLFNNSFEGEIPPNISKCSNLIQLNLGFNNIGGKIPVELSTLSKLQLLAFHDNRLMGNIPPSFGNLSSLVTLSARNNGFSGSIPDALDQMTSLMSLHLAGNKLSGTIPPTMYNLSSLVVLNVQENQLQGSLPSYLGFNLRNLRVLSISENQFHGSIPISVSNLSKLEQFYAKGNNFSGKLAIHFGGLSKLTNLILEDNHLGSGEANDLSFINTLTNCSSLTRLKIAVNRFGGVLPNIIANFSAQLSILSMQENQIVGNIPVGIGNLVSLEFLVLFDNLLGGSIPTSIGRLQMLKHLDLGGNGFTGLIPFSLGNLSHLNVLYLQGNRLHGKISSDLGKCKNLFGLGISNNNFSGIIPKVIFDLPMLVELTLGRNYFFGSLPLEVGRLTNLEIFEVSQNMLSGEIPCTLGFCTRLEQIFMQRNFFEGSIPLSLSSLTGLQDLDLSFNNFSGFIPKFLGGFKHLQNLNLAFNYLEGEVPVEGVFGNLSAVSVIGNNKLCRGSSQLHLPTCKTQKSRHHVFRLIVTICCCGASLCLFFVTFVFIICRGRKKRKGYMITLRDHYLRISYAELLKATDGFSSTNLIGVGSFGSVYKATLNRDELIVAVKVLNLKQKGASKSFIDECNFHRNMRHRNIVKILTICSSVDFEGNEFKALVYEFMSCGNLERWLHPHATGIQDEQRHLNLLQRLNIAIDIATTLDYLHQGCHVQIIYYDLKPSNILLDEYLVAHLGDFGKSIFLSADTSESQNQTSLIRRKRSIGYVPPGVNVSTRGDVYNYGILLLEMFTGKQPTDVMFKDDFNLHCWIERALHDGMMVHVDPSLLPMEEDGITRSQKYMKDKVSNCLNSIFGIGVTCSAGSPTDRMDMNDVLRELCSIRDIYLGIRSMKQ